MKKKNGFTLIELLAIIVILAIIAVVTVPIILEIIDDAKKGTIQDSAYGYKDAVNKWYAQELLKNKDLKLNGVYTVTDGALDGENVDNDEIPISGSIPKSGYLTYENNILTEGCLTIDEYAITFENGKISNAEKGECENPNVLPCPGPKCVYAVYDNNKNYGENGDMLANYETDYTQLNSDYFLGHILNDNGKIIRAFACILKDGMPICLEGTTDGSKYEKNKEILTEKFDGYTFYKTERAFREAHSNGCYFDEKQGNRSDSRCTYNYIDSYSYNEIFAYTDGLVGSGIYGGNCSVYSGGYAYCFIP